MMKVSDILILSLVLMNANFAVSAQSKIPTDAERETAAAAFTQNAVAPLVQNGIAAFTQKQNVAAITIMTKVLTLDPTNQSALLYRGIAFYQENQYERAKMDLERGVRHHPKYFDLHLNLGWTLYVLGDAERAVDHLRTTIELSPSAADWRGTLGAAELYTGEYQKCVEDLNYYAQRNNGLNVENLLQRAECHLHLGNSEAAKTDIFQAWKLNPNSYWAYLDQIREKGDKTCKTNAVKANQKAEELIGKGKYEEAYRETWNGLKCEPQNIPLLRTRLVIEARAKSMELAALTHYRQLAKIDRETNAQVIDRFESKFGHSILRKDKPGYMGLYDDASRPQWLPHKDFAGADFAGIDRVMIQEFETFPTPAGYIRRAAEKFSDRFPTNAFADRMQDLNSALELEPGNAEALVLRARTLITVPSGSLRNLAWRDATAALKINPNSAAAYNVRGIVYRRERNDSEALKQFDKALSINPDDDKALINRGLTQIVLKNPDGGFKDLSRAIKLAPKNAVYYRIRAREHQRANAVAAAIEDYRQSVALDASDEDSVIELVKIYDQTGAKDLADALHLKFYKAYVWSINNNRVARYNEIANRNPALIAAGAVEVSRETAQQTAAAANSQNAANQTRALTAYYDAMRQYRTARASYDDAVAKYNANVAANPNLQGMMNGTVERAKEQLRIMSRTLSTLINDHGASLPADKLAEVKTLSGNLPSTPF